MKTQCERILELLKSSQLTTGEIYRYFELNPPVIRNITGRISDLRKQKHIIERIPKHRHGNFDVFRYVYPQEQKTQMFQDNEMHDGHGNVRFAME